jgi:hypothetical protein
MLFRDDHLAAVSQVMFRRTLEKIQGKYFKNGGIGVVDLLLEKDLFMGIHNAFFPERNQAGHLPDGRDLLLHDRPQTGSQQAMDILIGRQVDLTAQAVDTVGSGKVSVKTLLVAYVRVNKKYTGKGQGEAQDAQDGIGRLSEQVFKGNAYVGAYHFATFLEVQFRMIPSRSLRMRWA